MQRSIGVTLTAIATILGSIVLLLMVLLLTVTLLLRPNAAGMTSLVRVSMVIGGGVLFALSAWGIATAAGLLRLHGWARWSMLTFCVLLVFIGITAAMGALFGSSTPPPGISRGVMRGFQVGMACFYALLAALGIFWLHYLNTPGVKAQFAGSASAQPPGGRPISITLIAALLLLGGGMCAILACLPMPAALLGWIVSGWAARLFYAGIGLIQLWLGWGLLRLKPLRRVLSMAFFVFGGVNSLLLALLPGATGRVAASMAVISPALHYGSVSQFPSMVGSILAVPFSVVPIWFLIENRPAFAPVPQAPPLPEPPPANPQPQS
jgi:hypothetical protein